MFIYLSKEKAKKGISLTIATSDTKINNFIELYGDDVIEYEATSIPQFVTYDENNNTIREATELEKVERGQLVLEENQAIINNQIITYDKDYQKIVDGKIVDKNITELLENGLITLAEVKEQKRQELKDIRAEKIDSDIEVNGDSFQVRERDLQNFYNLKIMIDVDKSRINECIAWVLADNRIKEFTYTQLMNVLASYIKRKEQLFHQFGVLAYKLEQAKTVEELEAIKWD